MTQAGGQRDNILRVLLLADTHIGLDLPLRPQIDRRRRGDGFVRNFELALEPALKGEVDLVVHAGDLLDRPQQGNGLLDIALAPLLRVADAGVPVYLVPGNHERRRIPLTLWTLHPRLHIFRQARTVVSTCHGLTVAVAGFPCPRGSRVGFSQWLKDCGLLETDADIRLLCAHVAVEGAQVGAHDYTFRYGAEVVAGRDVPAGCAALLAGHIHRHQILRQDLAGSALKAPVVYPGSVERTAFAERNEEKGYVVAEFTPTGDGAGRLVSAQFQRLPTRPMVIFAVQADALSSTALRLLLQSRLAGLHPDAVVRIRVQGAVSRAAQGILSARALRAVAPFTMNITVSYPRGTSLARGAADVWI